MKYKLLQGKRKVYILGEFNTHHEAIDYLIKKQKEGYKNLYIVSREAYDNEYYELRLELIEE